MWVVKMIKIPNKKNYDFCNLNINSSANAELFFYGEIVSSSWDAWQMEDQYPENVKSLIDDIGDRDIDIHINSPGGNVFAGCAIYNLLKNAKGTKTVYIDGVKQASSAYTVTGGTVKFKTAPASTAKVTADYTYYWKVMFADDGIDIERQYLNINKSKTFKLEVVR